MPRLLTSSLLAAAALACAAAPAAAADAALDAPTAASAAKKKCKAKKKCRQPRRKQPQRRTTAAPKDGTYTYTSTSAGSGGPALVTISGRGTRIAISEPVFSDPDDGCDTTTVAFGTVALRGTGIPGKFEWATGENGTRVPPVPTAGAGGGSASSSGQLDAKTMTIQVTNFVQLRTAERDDSCYTNSRFTGKLVRR